MNIYLVKEPNGARDYDCYDSFVIISESFDKARNHADNYEGMNSNTVVVSLVGRALIGFNEGDEICSSFNAG